MDFNWRFGRNTTEFSVPDEYLTAILERKSLVFPELPLTVQAALASPIGTKRLGDIIGEKNAESALIVLNDITRPTPYHEILPPLIDEITAAGIQDKHITLLIANGIHRPQTDQESRAMYGDDICDRFRLVNHFADSDLIDLGIMPGGVPLLVNRLVKESDILIATGLINLHYIAGFSGGRKSIVPGIAGRPTIEATHAMMADARARLANITDNPVNNLLLNGARIIGVDFILNVITDDNHQIAGVVAGGLETAWNKGVECYRSTSVCKLPHPADIVIAGCGGFPKDINLYQAQKALESSAQAVKEGGTIILVAACDEGMGENTFSRWIEEASSPQAIKDRFRQHFELGGHKAYAICRTLDKCRIILVSHMEKPLVEKNFMIYQPDVQSALEYALELTQGIPTIVLIPEASAMAVELGE